VTAISGPSNKPDYNKHTINTQSIVGQSNRWLHTRTFQPAICILMAFHGQLVTIFQLLFPHYNNNSSKTECLLHILPEILDFCCSFWTAIGMQSYPFKTRDLHNKLTQNNFHLDRWNVEVPPTRTSHIRFQRIPRHVYGPPFWLCLPTVVKDSTRGISGPGVTKWPTGWGAE